MPAPSALPASEAHQARGGPPRRSRTAARRAVALILVHVAIAAHVAHWKWTGRTLSPLEPSEAMQTLELGYVNAGFLVFVALLLLTAVLGRFFCGWACHVVAYQDFSAWLLGKIGVRPRAIRSRLLLLVPIGAALYMFVWPQVARVLEGRDLPALAWHLTTDSFWATFPSPAVAAITFLVDGFLIVYLLGGKAFCTYGCPYGALFAVGDRVAPVRIRVTDACEQCGHCTATCTSNVRVHAEVARHGMVVDPGCMKCLDCVSVCPKDALYVGVGRPSLAATGKRAGRRYDLTWPEELFAAAVFLGALYAFRGLYGLVPFLLALGLAVIAAFAALLVLRGLRAPELTLQSSVLKGRDGWTARGHLVLVAATALLLLAAHSAWIQFHTREAARLTAAARALPAAERDGRVDDALDHLAAVERYGLVTDERTLNLLSGAHRLRGDHRTAASYLRRSLRREETTEKLLALSTLEMHLRRTDAAAAALERVLALEPDHPEALRRLAVLRRR
ncbi:MAG: 4Fe-4S binding protein [Planctomycetota bacterium JB042]